MHPILYTALEISRPLCWILRYNTLWSSHLEFLNSLLSLTPNSYYLAHSSYTKSGLVIDITASHRFARIPIPLTLGQADDNTVGARANFCTPSCCESPYFFGSCCLISFSLLFSNLWLLLYATMSLSVALVVPMTPLSGSLSPGSASVSSRPPTSSTTTPE